MKKLLILVAVLTLASFGCSDSSGDAGTGGAGGAGGEGGSGSSEDVTITFAAVVGTETFVCGDSYQNLGSDDTTLTLVDFRFYVQDVELKNADDALVPVEL